MLFFPLPSSFSRIGWLLWKAGAVIVAAFRFPLGLQPYLISNQPYHLSGSWQQRICLGAAEAWDHIFCLPKNFQRPPFQLSCFQKEGAPKYQADAIGEETRSAWHARFPNLFYCVHIVNLFTLYLTLYIICHISS